MPIFKCKSCGGEITAQEGQSVAVCEYCQREQSLSRSKSEIVVNMFNRANSLRLKNDFDKSQEIYEKILVEEPNDAEAHWGIVLCKYGIEYVKEGECSYSEIPTCHRTQYESVLSDSDYLAAIQNSDPAQKNYYENEAKKIAGLQKNILQVVRNEKPFDVFICYKEKDPSGQRTNDSVIANDIYYQLTQEGFKVFYAAITLESKLGTAYEPYIFAALNSAKVMLVLGTKPEYFNAVWVRNEWARYLKIIKNDRSRLLIPCYRDMDAYELPEEFAHLQALDMSKVGFITDLIRGIKKIIPKESKSESPAGTTVISASETATPILKRVFLCIEDRDYQKAESLLEKVFNLDPECAEAYIAKMMIERKLTTKESLCSLDFDPKDDRMYMRALRFADGEYRKVLEEYRNESLYRKAIATKRWASNSNDPEFVSKNYDAALILFSDLKNYKDSISQRSECEKLKSEALYSIAKSAKQYADEKSDVPEYHKASAIFSQIFGYRDSAKLKAECEEKIMQINTDELYSKAVNHSKNDDISSLEVAIAIFSGISSWKDSEERLDECRTRLSRLKEQKEKLQKENDLKSELTKIYDNEKYYKKTLATAKKLKAKKIYYRIMLLLILATFVCSAFCIYRISQLNDEYHAQLSESMDDKGNIISQISDSLPESKYRTIGIPATIAFCVLIIINTFVTICLDDPKSLWMILIPGLNALLLLYGLFVGIKFLFCPLNQSERDTLNQYKVLSKNYKEISIRKSKAEVELVSLIGADGLNDFIMTVRSSDIKDRRRKKVKLLIVCVLIAVIAVLGLGVYIYTNIIPGQKYDEAINFIEQGKNQQAYNILKDIEGYKDSKSLITECEIQLMKTAKVGDTVLFGRYKQGSDDTTNRWSDGKESIEWIVLEKTKDKVMLISLKCLDQEPEIGDFDWKGSNARKWLNETFLKSAFSTAQQNRLIETELANMRDAYLDIVSDSTLDKVYLLSVEEVTKYFSTDQSRVAELTPQALNVIGGSNPEITGWRLRTPNNFDMCIAYVAHDGQIRGINDTSLTPGQALRPVIWVDISESVIESN